jgi:predicted XRE-type DNA-binding protein
MMSKIPKNKPTLRITESSGNVFADLGFANPEQELLKARLTLQIYRTIKARKLTQAQAGEILGIKQPHVSSLMRGQSGTFSVERLMDFLTALGHDIEIAVTPTRREHGRMSVSVAEPAKRPAI